MKLHSFESGTFALCGLWILRQGQTRQIPSLFVCTVKGKVAKKKTLLRYYSAVTHVLNAYPGLISSNKTLNYQNHNANIYYPDRVRNNLAFFPKVINS